MALIKTRVTNEKRDWGIAYGTKDDDFIFGGKTSDILFGGGGSDVFVIKQNTKFDHIVNFSSNDVIMLNMRDNMAEVVTSRKDVNYAEDTIRVDGNYVFFDPAGRAKERLMLYAEDIQPDQIFVY